MPHCLTIHPPLRPGRPGHLALLATLACAPLWSHAQVTQKPDGEWRSLFTAGASVATGNTHATSISVAADVIRLTDHDKWAFNANGQYARSDGAQTANRQSATGLHSRDITPDWFGFGQLDLLRDGPANLSSRATLGGGVGYHVIKNDRHTWDVSVGAGYTWDRYNIPVEIDDTLQRSDQHPDLLMAEESNHKLSETTSFKQKLSVYPNLQESRAVRTVFDAGLSVAMTQQLSLTATLSHRYDNRPADGLGRHDTLFVTGVSLRFD